MDADIVTHRSRALFHRRGWLKASVRQLQTARESLALHSPGAEESQARAAWGCAGTASPALL